jgi:hypothetical protein
MKIGDLVRLSSYGSVRRRADWIERGDIGIIVAIKTYPVSDDEYEVKWCRSDMKSARQSNKHFASYWQWERLNQRRDLKYAK